LSFSHVKCDLLRFFLAGNFLKVKAAERHAYKKTLLSEVMRSPVHGERPQSRSAVAAEEERWEAQQEQQKKHAGKRRK
jgi:hypothetical protein